MRVHSYLIVAFAFLTASVLSVAQAAPITYTLTGSMSGDADFTPFNNTAFTWTITGDTTQKQVLPSGFSGVPALTSVLDLTGVGTFTPLDPLFAVTGAPTFATFAFERFDGMGGIGFTAPELGSYDGISSIGPIAVNFGGTFLVPTAQGPTLFIVSGANLMFQAVTVPDVPDVPEPITLTLFGAGMAGIGAMRRRRKALA